jgi:hypothetical protein
MEEPRVSGFRNYRMNCHINRMPDTEVVPGNKEERATGVEPVPPAWKAEALPLRYARVAIILPFENYIVKKK